MSLQSVVDKLKNSSLAKESNLPFKFDGNLIEKKLSELRVRLPNLGEEKLICIASVLQAIDINQFTNSELEIIGNSGLEHIEYALPNLKYDNSILNVDNPSFDVGGIVVGSEFDRSELATRFKRMLASNKSLSQSFLINYITNIG